MTRPVDFAIDPPGRPFAWWIAAPLIIWSLHFLAVYIGTALVCAERIDMSADALRIAIGVVTAAAAIALTALIVWPAMKLLDDAPTSRSLLFAVSLASFLSLVALGLVSAPAFVLDACA